MLARLVCIHASFPETQKMEESLAQVHLTNPRPSRVPDNGDSLVEERAALDIGAVASGSGCGKPKFGETIGDGNSRRASHKTKG